MLQGNCTSGFVVLQKKKKKGLEELWVKNILEPKNLSYIFT